MLKPDISTSDLESSPLSMYDTLHFAGEQTEARGIRQSVHTGQPRGIRSRGCEEGPPLPNVPGGPH